MMVAGCRGTVAPRAAESERGYVSVAQRRWSSGSLSYDGRMGVALLFLGAIVHAGCSTEPSVSDLASLAQADLTRGDWRLFSSVFPALPAEG